MGRLVIDAVVIDSGTKESPGVLALATVSTSCLPVGKGKISSPSGRDGSGKGVVIGSGTIAAICGGN